MSSSATQTARQRRDHYGDAWLDLDSALGKIPEGATVAFSISGGGASGGFEAGAMASWWDATENQPHLRPRLLVGTSAGALNAVAAFLDLIGMTPLRREANEFYGKRIWSELGDSAAKYVVDHSESVAVSALSKWVKWPPWNSRALQILIAFCLLVGAAALTRHAALLLPLSGVWPDVLTAVVTALFGAGAFWLIGPAAFRNNRPLHRTIVAVAKSRTAKIPSWGRLSRKDEQEVGVDIVKRWKSITGVAPSLVLTATNLTTRAATLFVVGDDKVFNDLHGELWHTYKVALANDPAGHRYPWVDARDLIQCIVASTSIPGVFPSRRITLHPADRNAAGNPLPNKGAIVTQDFVDGGVLHNAPVHIAIDAGASVVISFELDPLVAPDPYKQTATKPPPNIATNVAGTFMTLLNAATAEDISGAVAWNRVAKDDPTKAPGKDLVPIFRVAPWDRWISTLDFNGSAEGRTLLDWLQAGEDQTKTNRCIWDATFQASPYVEPRPPPSRLPTPAAQPRQPWARAAAYIVPVFLLGGAMIRAGGPSWPSWELIPQQPAQHVDGVSLYTGGISNALALDGADGLLLVDTKLSVFSRQLEEDLERDFPGRKVHTVVLTHGHVDHVGGLRRFTKDLKAVYGAEVLKGLLPDDPQQADRFHPVHGTDSFTLRSGVTIDLYEFDHAHTGGDTAVWIPSAGVLATGDIFQCGYYPHAERDEGGSYKGIRDAAAKLLTLNPQTIMGGHGGICGRADLEKYVAYMTAVVDGTPLPEHPYRNLVMNPFSAPIASLEQNLACAQMERAETNGGGWHVDLGYFGRSSSGRKAGIDEPITDCW